MAKPAPVIDDRTSLLIAEQGKAFSFSPAATGSPTLWEAVGLPAGLAINASTGAITGTPTVAGVYGVILRATNYDSRAFTVDTGTDVITSNGHPFADGDLIEVDSTTALPSPLLADTLYEVRDATGTTYKLAASAGGPAIDLTTAGTGTHTASLPQTDELTIILPILRSTSRLTSADIALEMDVDVVTGRVSILGMGDYVPGLPLAAQPVTELKAPVIGIKSNDRFPVLVGFTRDGVLQELDVASIVIGGREANGEPRFALSEGAFTKTGTGSSTRFRGVIHAVKSTIDSILNNYEEDPGSQADVPAEISYQVNAAVPDLIDETASAALTLEGGHNGGSEYTGTLVVGGVSVFDGSIAFSLTVELAVTARASQDCEIVRTFNLSWDGSAFALASAAGPTSDAGAADGDNWIVSSLALGTIAGTASGLSIPYTLGTSDDANVPYSYFQIPSGVGVSTPDETQVDLGSPAQILLYAGDTYIGEFTLSGTYVNAAALEADIEAEWEATTSAADVQAVTVDLPGTGAVTIKIELTAGSEITKILFGAGSYPGDEYYVVAGSVTGTARAATLSANLVQVGAWPSTVYRRTSETVVFRLNDEINTES